MADPASKKRRHRIYLLISSVMVVPSAFIGFIIGFLPFYFSMSPKPREENIGLFLVGLALGGLLGLIAFFACFVAATRFAVKSASKPAEDKGFLHYAGFSVYFLDCAVVLVAVGYLAKGIMRFL